MDHYYDSQLYEYMTKRCNTYDNATRSIHTNDLNRLCHHFRLDYHNLVDALKIDSQSRIASSDIVYVLCQDTRLSPSMQSPHQTANTSYSRGSRGYDVLVSSVSRRRPFHDIQYPYESGIPDTDESYTPDQDYTPDDNSYNPQEISGCRSPSDNQKPDYDPHWSNPSSPPDSGVPPSHAHQKRTEEGYITSTRNRGKYCASCTYWQSKAQELEDQLVSVNKDSGKLQSIINRQQKEMQQNFAAYQAVSKENSRYKQEMKRVKEGSLSDGGSASTGYLERQIEELKRSKEESDRQYKRYYTQYSGLKQENDRLKYQIHQQQQDIWYLQDEKQKLETTQLQRDTKLDGRVPGYFHSVQQPSDPDTEPVKASRNKQQQQSAMSDNSEGSPHVFVVLGEDVSASVLPESLTHEQHYQLVCGLQNCHSIEELLRCLVSYGIGTLMNDKSQGIKVENEYLKSLVKSLQAKCNTLSSSFESAKLETDDMFRKMSSVEANNCRLRRIVSLCQQACEVHEMLYEMKEAEARPPSTSSPFSPMDFDSPTRTNSHDISSGKNVLSRVRSLLKLMESNQELQTFLPTVYGNNKTSSAGWNLSMSQYTGTTSGLSCPSSLGPEAELNSTEIEQLKVYYQALVRYSKHLLDTLIEIDGLQGVDTVKEPTILKDSISSDLHGSRILDLEDAADTEELCKIREEKAELRSQIFMMEQSKRSMELQLSRKTLQCSMLERQCSEQRNLQQTEKKKKQRLKDKIKHLRAENPHVPDWSEQNEDVRTAWEAESISAQRYDELFGYMQTHVDKSQNMTEKLVEFVKELLRANRALVEAFERAKKRQQTEKRQLKSELKNLMHKPHSSGQL